MNPERKGRKFAYTFTSPDGVQATRLSTRPDYMVGAFRVLETDTGDLITDYPNKSTDVSCTVQFNAVKMVAEMRAGGLSKYWNLPFDAPRPKIVRVVSLNIIPTDAGVARGIKPVHVVIDLVPVHENWAAACDDARTDEDVHDRQELVGL